MDNGRFGLTPEERQHLGPKPDGVREMETLAGMLAFAGLLLVAALIIAASLIVRSYENPDPGPVTTNLLRDPSSPVTTTQHDHPKASDEYRQDSTHQQSTDQEVR